ncbi:hypothetical protein ACWOFR_12020 [Carnobacterium gallinarum]|uniref:hypothetical protein n=1 Tax=Carnobacterium gallinarum TaxID=2749 RepID=UPI000689800E|nr:hypothetical protein [Carnobacterium gallinarum]
MEYRLITKTEDIEVLLDEIFTELGMRKRIKKVLKHFSLKEGCVIERKAILFKEDLDEFDLSQLKIPLDDCHILIEVDAIASTINENSQAYLMFTDFYNYLERNIKKYISLDDEISSLLLEIKHVLKV